MRRPVSVRKVTLLVCVVSAMALALLGAEIVSYSRNTLLNHPEWISGKLTLSYGVMGAGHGMRTRNLLQRNRLNLHEWFGFNEILVNRVFAFGSVELSFRLEDESYLYVVFNKTATSFCGVRLSRMALLPDIYFRADNKGRFLERQALGDLGVTSGWHTVTLRARDGAVEVDLDGRLVRQLPVQPHAEQMVGIRSGSREALVDDVVVMDAGGEVIVDEDFRNDRFAWPLRGSLFAGFLVLFAVIVGFARYRRLDRKQFLFRLVLGVHLLLLTMLLCFCVDYLFWSSRYPYQVHVPWTQRGYKFLGLETLRSATFAPFAAFDARDESGAAIEVDGPAYAKAKEFLGVEARQLPGHVQVFRTGGGVEPFAMVPYNESDLRAYLETSPLDSAYTILFLGSSQTRGEGAGRSAESLVARAHADLAARMNRPLASFNGAINASDSHELLRYMRTALAPLRPDLVVVNLSNNDVRERFAEGLQALLRESRERGAAVLFFLEANSMEFERYFLRTQHQIMRDVATTAAVPVVNLYEDVASREAEDAGIFWWDRVHLTSFGQAVAAESIAGGIFEHFGEQLTATP